MAYIYLDSDGGSDASDGTTWANAKLTFEGALAVAAAGDTIFFQGAAADNHATLDRTFASPGTPTNPVHLVGVVDGTTNTGTSVGTSDLASTLPVISTTGTSLNLVITGSLIVSNVDFSASGRFTCDTEELHVFNDCKISYTERSFEGAESLIICNDCELETLGNSGIPRLGDNTRFIMNGGVYTFTAATHVCAGVSLGEYFFTGVDFSGLGTTSFLENGATSNAKITLRNCRVPATFNKYESTPTLPCTYFKVIDCTSDTSVTDTDSLQMYYEENCYGVIETETTMVRTGGANDNAKGAYALKMTPNADAVRESMVGLVSPVLHTWVAAGSNTIEIYIANDSASTDYNEDEVWCEFFTPDAGDTAQADLTFNPAAARKVDSATALTDDTGSTWGTGANNHQKFSITVSSGYEGLMMARVHLAKRQASPDSMLIDPKPVVS